MGRRRGARRHRRTAGVAVALVLLGGGQAHAASVELGEATMGGERVQVLAAVLRDGAADWLGVYQDGSYVKFSVFYSEDEFTEPLPPGCAFSRSAVHARQVDCDLSRTPPVQAIGGHGLGGDDVIDAAATSVPFIASGGPGADTITGSGDLDELDGGAGDDVLHDSPGPDALQGGDGDDRLVSAVDGDRDQLDGGEGRDTAAFSRSGAITVTLDGRADDGAVGEGDDVRVEDLTTSTAGATFVGDAGPNTLRSTATSAGAHPNRFEGGGGADRLLGAGGRDELLGGDGDDELVGGDDGDVVDGGDGTDALTGDGPGGRPGDDTLLARDGRSEQVDCGAGTDRAELDAGDAEASGAQGACETVDRPPVPQGPGPAPDPAPARDAGPDAAGGGAPPVPLPGLGPRGVGLRLSAARDRRAPFAFRLSGRIDAPAGRCAGSRVLVRLLRGRRPVRRVTARVTSTCTWGTTLRLGRRSGRFRLQVRFLGGPALAAQATALQRTLRTG